MTPTLKCAILVERIGPYHQSRITAASTRLRTVVVEFFGIDSTYAWDKIPDAAGFQRFTLLDRSEPNDRRDHLLVVRVHEALTRIAPDVVAIPGWSSKGALAALNWCMQTGTPSIVLSASSDVGKERAFWKEAIKRRIVRLFSAGVGGGTPQADYLARLGIPRSNIFPGYDVVDNVHFAEKAAVARRDAPRLRHLLHLPENYFLGICRFIDEKNLHTLLEAYDAYRRQAGPAAWKLVLVGDGPLRPQLIAQRERLDLTEALLLPGFKQYEDLPIFYGLAKAFILPSLSETWGLVVNEAMASGLPVIVSDHCGCATDLVRNGENGFTFDPNDTAKLTSLLNRLASPATNLTAMGQSSLEIISRWTPDTFANSLQHAAEKALNTSLPAPGPMARLLLKLLMNR